MQKSCLFFLSACFTATVVLSERIALAPIDALTDFVSSNRNAQETDDGSLEGLAELILGELDENFVKCSVDTTTKMSVSEMSAIQAATDTFLLSVDEDLNVEFPKEARETYGQVCADNGGYLNVAGGTLSCSTEGVSFSIAGYATCSADTKACKAVDPLDMYKVGVKAATGAVCDVIVSSDSSDTSAGAGHHWSFNYLALSGMVVGASFF
jgi:hypothetical protein